MNTAQIAAAARALRIPAPGAETLKEIQAVEGETLVRATEEARTGVARASFYLRGVLLACHESTIQRLVRGRLAKPPLRTMVAIGRAEGPEFAMRLKEWAEAGMPEGDDARYVRLTLARHLEAGAAAATTQPPSAAPAIVNLVSYRPHRGVPGSEATPVPLERATSPRREPQQDCMPANQVEPTESTASDQEYLSQHIYGGKAAACFGADQTRAKVHTVRLEAAEASAVRQYDWRRKVAIQLSQRELPMVLAVFMGWLPRFEGKGHGENNSKWFTLENQGNKLYLSVNAKGQSPRGVPIMPGDGYAVTTLLMRQMLKNDPFLTPEILLSLVRKEAALACAEARPTARAA